VSCGNYYAGDELCVWAENEAGLVERFGQQLGIADLDEMFLLQAISKVGGCGKQGRAPAAGSIRKRCEVCSCYTTTRLRGKLDH
jgi:hypothetical protein